MGETFRDPGQLPDPEIGQRVPDRLRGDGLQRLVRRPVRHQPADGREPGFVGFGETETGRRIGSGRVGSDRQVVDVHAGNVSGATAPSAVEIPDPKSPPRAVALVPEAAHQLGPGAGDQLRTAGARRKTLCTDRRGAAIMSGMDTAQVTDPARVGVTGIRGGRRLAWAEWGPSDGRPVLFCPGAGWGRWLGFGCRAAAELDIRLISVERPGSGESTGMPGRTLLDWADDIGRLGLADPAVVGFSQGAPFALALAARGLTSAVAIVSGGDELAYPGTVLPAEVQRLVDRVAADPEGAERDFAQFGSAETLWRLSVESSPEVDHEIYRQPDFAAALRRALDSGFAQGPAGYARDTVLHFARWPFRVEEITARVHLWYGGQDDNPTHSPDHGATLAARIPNATRHFLPDSGAALLWTHAGEILRQLLAQSPGAPA